MDQALIQGTFAGLYEKLVADVAARVVAMMAEKPVFVCDAEMRAIAAAVFEEKIDGALENYDCSDAIDEALKDIDFDSKVEDAVEGIDWEDKVKGVLKNLRVELVPR